MPRTQTNDPALAFRGFPTIFVASSHIVNGTVLYSGGQPGQISVVTNIDVVSVATTTSATILIGLNLNSCGIFGAQTGAGAYDTFSWRGFLPLALGDGLVALHADDGWHCVAAGFLVPDTSV